MAYTGEQKREYARNWIRRRRDAWFRANGPCVDCGSWERLELDHENPADKIAHAVWSWSEPRRLAELAKCKPRCKSCHQKKTARENSQRKTSNFHGTAKGYFELNCRCVVCIGYGRRNPPLLGPRDERASLDIPNMLPGESVRAFVKRSVWGAQ